MRVAVFGGGSWGTALAAHARRVGHDVRLWVRESEVVDEIRSRGENTLFLPGVRLPDGLTATTDLGEAASGAEVAVVAIPSAYRRTADRQIHALLPERTPLVSATKGIELGSLQRMTEVAAQAAPGRRVAVLSGPSFALEVGLRQPTAVVVAASAIELASSLQRALASREFRIYTSDDVLGVELSGALKNVIAIAAGILDGLGYGRNTEAALITRGLAEISRLVVAAGGRAETAAGLAGLGDLVLTCTGALSRNRRIGRALGAGQTLAQAEAALDTAVEGGPHLAAGAKMVAEGVPTTLAACELAERAGVEMPIALQMRAVLYEGKPPREALNELMLRSLKRE
jgi:glycerol-3-phosphate dehydrogenase (NAD(P)+)